MKKRIRVFGRKILSLFLVFLITFSSIFSFPIVAFADNVYVGRVTANDVFFRSTPTTKPENGVSNVITSLDEGDVVTVLSIEKVGGAKGDCSSGWYSIQYKDKSGYICSTYISVDGYDIYDRPWTSPKKAIIGGAKFIGKSYISRGQFTSYLKKYNVNPDGDFEVYNHLYMSNLAAPSSEAKTSYTAYQKNGLLDLPLVFNIPIYKKMEDSYDRPGGNLTKIEKQSEVKDQAFEDLLDKQEFPESYKEALRALHEIHPNWTFVSMYTDLTFSKAVNAFQIVGAIQGGEKYYELEKGKPVQAGNDKGWYVPNKETTAYYLDPRNFLTEQYILQFESLENSEVYTESVVQSILKGTFMEGISILDNQSYASIFVEAGKSANVSSVYLASLARQESGVNGSGATTGNEFEYEDVTYSGLFNFFNIGASSGASNPLKAGLVYASGGSCTKCDNNTQYTTPIPSETPGENTNPSTPATPEEPKAENLKTLIEEGGYQVSGEYVHGFKVGTSVEKVEKNLANGVTVKTDNDIIGTGDKITYNGETYLVVVYGDLTGDGKINSADLLKMRKYLLGDSNLSGAYKESAYLTDDSKINSADLLKMRQYLRGDSKISQ